MKNFKLRHIFNTAVLAGLTALSALTGCDPRTSPVSSPAADTQLVCDTADWINPGWWEWDLRQDYSLMIDSNRNKYQTWLSNLDDAQNLSLLEKANRVNDLVNNTVTYLDDDSLYGGGYWAPGVETVLSGAGDCEDFAIAKFYALKYLKVPENRVFLLLVATDTAVSKKTDHMVLAVDTTAANNWVNCLILDNYEGRENSLETLGQNGYMPLYMGNTKELHKCTLKVLKTPAP